MNGSIWLKDINSEYEEVITNIRDIKDLTMLLKMYMDKGYTPTGHKELGEKDEYYLAKE